MALQGLVYTLDVIRRTETVDSVGGSVYTESTTTSGVSCRVGNASQGIKQALREQGYETARVRGIVAQPSNLSVRENDHVLIHGGLEDGLRFLVLLVKKDNLPSTDDRSHVELAIERLVKARTSP